MNTSLLLLRGVQLGFSLDDILFLEVGELMDILIEAGNDSYDYPIKGAEEDFAKLFGG